MGIAAELGYAPSPPGVLRRGVHAVAATRGGASLLARVLPPLDRGVGRLTGGRTTLCALLSGLPVLVVETTGRRTGRARRTQLVGVPVRDTLALLGTSFGGTRTPAWVHNVEADGRVLVTFGGRTVRAIAREADPVERAEVLAAATRLYVGYARYLDRVTGRRVRVLLLERGDPGG
ncbi:nitroreductase family deazaflavin-dependent oxidoreductase [Phycicoccus avicenniae]|uniref:nitroreductase family deazaflavin-dependent oxidoreductase n=1 Tax=Phycicoccus avicenniae TaxID=2828860 RepID=UPI003D2BB977